MKYQVALSLPIAACLIILGPNLAQARSAARAETPQAMAPSNAGMHEAMRMVPAQANLVKTFNAKDMQAGQHFRAKLNGTVHLKNGPELPKGTVLVGTVVTDRMNRDGQTSTLALRFNRADLKDGKVIPIKATIVGIYPPMSGSSYGQTEVPNYWTAKTLQVDQIGAIGGVDLHSKIAASNSAVFVSHKKSDMRFNEGSEFAIAIAARNARG
ncbi:MAG: hypothetical protein ACRD27_06685 [Terracidiphilus sp.]